MNEPVQCGIPAPPRPIRDGLRRAYHAITFWLFLYIWCRHLYRPTMRLMHHFNLHHAPPSLMDPIFGEHNHWCQWCGMRGKTYVPDPNAPLRNVRHP